MAASRRSDTAAMTIAAIFADWGTTNRRAWAVDRSGAVLDHRHDAEGLLGVKDRAFEASFRAFAGDWLRDGQPSAPVMMAGMVGSKLGWREATYIEAPCAFADLADVLTAIPDLDGHPVRIVPGLVCRALGFPDVMRGEETQLYGFWLRARSDRLCVLPGTHSKWAEIASGGIAGFRTYMTGEVFALLSGSGTLAQLMRKDAPHDQAAFRRGVEAMLDEKAGSLLNRLFSVRGLGLFGEIGPEALASYLSGLLIGDELRDVARRSSGDAVPVIGSSRMAQIYVEALKIAGITAEAVDGDVLLRAALLEIAQAAGLM
jgi:2-dehydro-3-deoxygalactonokinase